MDALTESVFPSGNVVDGHLWALAVSGLANADAYYRCPFEGGEAYVLVQVDRTRYPDPGPPEVKVARVITELLLAQPIALTRRSIESYLAANGVTATAKGSKVRIDGPSNLTIKFDRLGRVTELSATARP